MLALVQLIRLETLNIKLYIGYWSITYLIKNNPFLNPKTQTPLFFLENCTKSFTKQKLFYDWTLSKNLLVIDSFDMWNIVFIKCSLSIYFLCLFCSSLPITAQQNFKSFNALLEKTWKIIWKQMFILLKRSCINKNITKTKLLFA